MAPSPSGGGGSGPTYYVPTGLNTADNTWQGLLGNMGWLYNNTGLQQYGLRSLDQGLSANDVYSPGYQNAANAAGSEYGDLANLLKAQSTGYQNTQQGLLNAGQNVYNLGLDPQNALYAKMQQQTTDQANAVNSMYGLGSSAAGAGMTDQALQNFNINWQNNQLGRAMQGLQGMTSADQLAGQYGQAAQSAGAAVPGATLAGGQLPYTTSQSIAATPGQLANTYGQFLNTNVYGPAEGIMGSIIPYMNYGQGAQAVPYQNAYNQAQAMGGAVYNGINGAFNNPQVQSSLGNAFSNYFGGGGYGAQDAMGYGVGSAAPYYSGGGNSYGFTM
jgi:hypothetical protein